MVCPLSTAADCAIRTVSRLTTGTSVNRGGRVIRTVSFLGSDEPGFKGVFSSAIRVLKLDICVVSPARPHVNADSKDGRLKSKG